MQPGKWYDPKHPPRKGGWGGDEAEQRARRAKLVTHAISLGWKKRLNGRDTATVGEYTFKAKWPYLFRGLYVGYVADDGTAAFYRDLALTDEYGKCQLEDAELQVLSLLAMREYPEIIQEW